MLEIKELTINDFDDIKNLFKGVFTAPPWKDDWSDENQLNEYLLDLMKVRNPLDFGLFKDGELIGISIGNIRHWWGGTEYHIEELCIKTDQQGQGLGTKFFELIEDILHTQNITNIFLMTERTVPAYDFYKKRGFTELSEHVSFLKYLK